MKTLMTFKATCVFVYCGLRIQNTVRVYSCYDRYSFGVFSLRWGTSHAIYTLLDLPVIAIGRGGHTFGESVPKPECGISKAIFLYISLAAQ